MTRMPLVILASEISYMLEEAIDKKDWNIVCQAFLELSGETKEITDKPVSLEDIKSEILASVMDALGNGQKKPTVKKQSKKSTKQQEEKSSEFSVDKKSRKVKATSENKFESMHDVIEEAAKEKNFDKIDDNVEPSQRARRPSSTKSVKCVECQSVNSVHPLFARENFTCDRCLGKRRPR